MRAISLFAGIGGFDLALQRAGVEVTVMVEIDKACQAVLRRKFPNATGYSDVTKVTGRQLGHTDIIVGGFPCQDVSVAGKRAGLAGERTGLFFEAVRIINETQPQYVVLENVPGLLSSNDGADMGTVLGTLAELGYGLAYRILDAQYFGVAQRRRRVFIVGSLGDWDGPREILFEPESLRGDSAAGGKKRAEVTGTLESGANRTGGVRPPGTTVDTADTLQVVSPSVIQRNLQTSHIAGTITNPGDGGRTDNRTVYDGLTVRRLTPRECERLQGFPDDWTAGQSDAQRYRQLGNAVAVPVVEWIARRLVAFDTAKSGEVSL